MKPLTAEEKQRQRDRLKDVPDDVKEEAIAYTSSFITKTMKRWGFNLQNGPFSYGDGGQAPVPVMKINMLRKIA